MVEDNKRARPSSMGASRLHALSALRMRPIHSSWLAIDLAWSANESGSVSAPTTVQADAGVARKRTGG